MYFLGLLSGIGAVALMFLMVGLDAWLPFLLEDYPKWGLASPGD